MTRAVREYGPAANGEHSGRIRPGAHRRDRACVRFAVLISVLLGVAGCGSGSHAYRASQERAFKASEARAEPAPEARHRRHAGRAGSPKAADRHSQGSSRDKDSRPSGAAPRAESRCGRQCGSGRHSSARRRRSTAGGCQPQCVSGLSPGPAHHRSGPNKSSPQGPSPMLSPSGGTRTNGSGQAASPQG